MTPETEPLPADKLFDHHRQQLSAMLDGALAPDQARFLLRRLQHDSELAACWERWQLCGDVMRGHADALLPRGFAQRVAAAIAAAQAPQAIPVDTPRRPRWALWGGGTALAASVAMAALLVLRPAPDGNDEVASGSGQVVVAAASAPRPAATPSTPANTRQAPATVASMAAVPEAASRNTPRRSRGQSQRAALANAARRIDAVARPVRAVAASSAAAATAADPFAIAGATTPERPWPRAIGPQVPASGGFTVGLGSSSAAAPSFYPFQPPVSHPVAGDAAPTADDPAAPAVAEDPPPP